MIPSGSIKFLEYQRDRNLEGNAYEKQKNDHRDHHWDRSSDALERCFYPLIEQHGRAWRRDLLRDILWHIR